MPHGTESRLLMYRKKRRPEKQIFDLSPIGDGIVGGAVGWAAPRCQVSDKPAGATEHAAGIKNAWRDCPVDCSPVDYTGKKAAPLARIV